MRSGSADLKTLGGALLLSAAFGSLHAFSVLLEPLEKSLAADRADISLGYSLAIVSVTAGVFFSSRARAFFNPPALTMVAGLGAASGLLAASAGAGLFSFLVGYGTVFGFGNGRAYNLSSNARQARCQNPRAWPWASQPRLMVVARPSFRRCSAISP
jgi:hypothetical protein